MKIEVNIEKKYTFLIVGVLIALGIGMFAYAGSYTNPSTGVGHDVNEINWAQQIPQGISVNGNVGVAGNITLSGKVNATGDVCSNGGTRCLNSLNNLDVVAGSGIIITKTGNTIRVDKEGTWVARGTYSYSDDCNAVCNLDSKLGTVSGRVSRPDPNGYVCGVFNAGSGLYVYGTSFRQDPLYWGGMACFNSSGDSLGEISICYCMYL